MKGTPDLLREGERSSDDFSLVKGKRTRDLESKRTKVEPALVSQNREDIGSC